MILCSVIAIILSAVFVNMAVRNTFNKYMLDNQNQRNARIVEYFQEIYKRDRNWNIDSGREIMHEAYMSSYCITLLDSNKKLIWGMNPENLKDTKHSIMMNKDNGVYSSNIFEIKLENKIVGYLEIGQYSPILLSQSDINFQMSINKSIIISVILAIIVSIIISIIISKQFSKPIKAFSDISVKLSKGDYSVSINDKSSIIEINKLMNSINVLRDKLQMQDKIRKRLVSDISHEIRTPLNILQNNIEAMIDGIFPVSEERLNYLNDEVIRFSKLLNNLNTLNEFEDEKIDLKFSIINLSKLINSISKEFYIDLNKKNLKIHFQFNRLKSFCIVGDRDKIKQVFINIISNAIKFSKSHGNIWINIYEKREKILVTIKDDGIGIKEEDLPYIFERLYRGDKSRNEIKGSGIGLTIVKRILLLHSAEITVESTVNKETEFKLIFNKVNIQ